MKDLHRIEAVLLLLAAFLLASAVPAQRGFGPGRWLGSAADDNADGVVSKAEWQGFLTRCGAKKKAVLDMSRVQALLLANRFDKDGSGKIDAGDLASIWKALDKDANGTIEGPELSPPSMRQGLSFDLGVAVHADRDANGKVTKEEWDASLASLKLPLAVRESASVVSLWLEGAKKLKAKNRNAITAAVFLLSLESSLDVDKDGKLTALDLLAWHSRLDTDKNGELSARELLGNRTRAPRRTGRRMPGARRTRPQAAPNSKPLLAWQRTLEDALQISKMSGKPLLICVNMDNEAASERLAASDYRSERFAQLAEGFVPLIVSPDRHSTYDHDSRGRRIVDPRFGVVTCTEHIAIEPELFRRYFRGRQVAPRHLAVSPDGKVLFDIFLTNNFESIYEAMKKHGRREAKAARKIPQTLEALLTSPYAKDRTRLENRFQKGDAALRIRLAGDAFELGRETRHPELLHLAFRDRDPRVVAAAFSEAIEDLTRLERSLLPELARVADRAPAARARLIAALLDAKGKEKDEKRKAALERLLTLQEGLATRSALIDVSACLTELRIAPRIEDRPFAADEDNRLDKELDRLEKAQRAEPSNARIALRTARVTMRYAQFQIFKKRNPSYLLEDVKTAAERAALDPSLRAEAMAWRAWANFLISNSKEALDDATVALGGIDGFIATPLAMQVLELFVHYRTKAIYDELSTGAPLSASQVADTRAAYAVLIEHPGCQEATAVQALVFANALGSQRERGLWLQRIQARWPLSGSVHAQLRSLWLSTLDPTLVGDRYRKLPRNDRTEASLLWFEGLARLVAAEELVRERRLDEAMEQYRSSDLVFASSVKKSPGFAASAGHYRLLAASGLARLLLGRKQIEEAAAILGRAIPLAPKSKSLKDGLGKTALETGRALSRALRQKGLTELAKKLEDALGS